MVGHLVIEFVNAGNLFLGQEFAVFGVILLAQVEHFPALVEFLRDRLAYLFFRFVAERFFVLPFALFGALLLVFIVVVGAQLPHLLVVVAVCVDEFAGCGIVEGYLCGNAFGPHLHPLFAVGGFSVFLLGDGRSLD